MENVIVERSDSLAFEMGLSPWMTFVDSNGSVFSFGVKVAALFGLLFVVRWNRDSDRTEMRAVSNEARITLFSRHELDFTRGSRRRPNYKSHEEIMSRVNL